MKNSAQEAKVIRLYEKYHRLLLTVARNATDDQQLVEDAVQNTYLKIIRFIDRLNEEDPHKLGRLLIIMCRQAVVALYREKMRSLNTWEHLLFSATQEDTPERCLERIMIYETVEEVKQCLWQLGPKYAVPLAMRFLHGMTITQIAQRLKLPENTTYMRIYRGREKLRIHMGVNYTKTSHKD